jgi:hypothetical protein
LRGREFIVGGRAGVNSTKNPYGFLRKIDSISTEGGDLVVHTSPTSLAQVLKNADYRLPTPSETLGGSSVVVRPQSLSGGEDNFNFSGQQLFDQRVGSAHVTGRIAKGTLSFRPEVDVHAQIRWFDLKNFEFVVRGAARVHIEVALAADGAFSTSFSRLFPVGDSFPVGSIGPVPLTGRIEVRVACELSAEGAYTATPGFDASVDMEAGARYDGDDWTMVKSFTPTFTPRFALTGLGHVDARCTAAPVVSLLIADMVGPALELGAYVHAHAFDEAANGQRRADLDLGLTARLHGRVRFLRWNLVDLDTTLFDKSLLQTSWPN